LQAIMRHLLFFALTAFVLAATPDQNAFAQATQDGTGGLRITWEVKNRFRLFRSEADFQRHVTAQQDDGVLGAEERLARESDGRGWAREVVERLCTDRAGRVLATCERDGVRENYLSPSEHRIAVALSGPGAANSTCMWSFDLGEPTPREVTAPCEEEVNARVPYGRSTFVEVEVILGDGTAQHLAADIAVRDVLIAGIGDSIAAGEGNPDRAVRLSDIGFCFRRFLGGEVSEYWRPGREAFSGNKSCSSETQAGAAADNWARQSARWQSGTCHRSLYGYQMRTALALAVENPHLAVTFVPLACSGATITNGFFGPQRIRECAIPGGGGPCPGTTTAQLAELNSVLTAARRERPDRALDLVLLTIGANDIQFSGLVANVIIQATTERLLFSRGDTIASVGDSQKILDGKLPADFARLRAALKPLVDGDLSRVVFVSYANPAMAGPGMPCPGGREGFDVHPAFGVDGDRVRQVTDYVSRQFLPKIKALATCQGGGCRDPKSERMSFVDAHQLAFVTHGVCTHADDDPEFDRECFSSTGASFNPDLATAATDPMLCDHTASEYQPYAPRQRWVRTANDSYFTAMTYPQGLSLTMQPASIHDATWGILSAVYGGAIHPTAQGHAAMADAALPAVREALGINLPVPTIHTTPLPPPGEP
jgi:hypothetical protein